MPVWDPVGTQPHSEKEAAGQSWLSTLTVSTDQAKGGTFTVKGGPRRPR